MRPINKIALGLLASAVLYAVSITGIGVAAELKRFGSEKIRDLPHLEQVLEEEQKKFGIENAEIKPYLQDDIMSRLGAPTAIMKTSKGEVRLGLDSNFGNYRASVKHELTHYKNGDLGDPRIKYWLVNEPRANLCGSFDICL